MKSVACILKKVEVVHKGERKDSKGKMHPWFQAMNKHDKGVSLYYLNGDGVEVGKFYDLEVYLHAYRDEIYGNLMNAEEVEPGVPF